MRQKTFLFSILFIQGVLLFAQVGINTENPSATLDVGGNVLTQEKLYLENPGRYLGEAGAQLLVIKDADDAVVKYDIENSGYGPINYVQYAIMNVSDYGLTGGFDTKIDANLYSLAVHGFYFNASGNTNVSMRSTVSPDQTQKIEGQQFYAYVQNGTWWLRGQVNNSQFYIATTLTPIDIYMDVVIYRNDFITKIWPGVQSINMGASATGTAPLPNGFD